MATQGTPLVPISDAELSADAAVQRPWRMRASMSRFGDAIERFLGASGFDRAPWLVVAFAAGVGSWFVLHTPWQWILAGGLALLIALASQALWKIEEARTHIRLALTGLGLAFAAGLAVVWARSDVVGAEPIDRPASMMLDARILSKQEQPAEGRYRLVLATRDATEGRAMKLRVNVPLDKAIKGLDEGARIRLRVRLMPPSPPLLPGGYDFARAAWFEGFAATGSLVGEIEIVEDAGVDTGLIARAQRFLSAHVRENLAGSAGSIAAAFASGDRGAIAEDDEVAMRDAGLTHLLAISGLHVSAVIAAAYFLAIRLLALSPWIALRVRLPLAAAGFAAMAGIAYTLLTGAQVPTVRSCIGAILVLIALALGREPLSLRMVAVAAAVVLLLWPETLVGPSFQMSFAAVLAIVALHNARPVKDFLAPREESRTRWLLKRILMLFVTGLVIEMALMPIVLFHFHRAGLYGAFANVLAIPLVTFVSMPLIAAALLLDLVGLGAPFWWLAGQSLDLLLLLAHTTSAQPGAVKLVPHIGLSTVLLFVAGGLWLALWRGRWRLAGLLPAAVGGLLLAMASAPDILISRDGRDVGLVDREGRLFMLRDKPGSFGHDSLAELAGVEAASMPMAKWPGARCSADFCSLPIERGKRVWHLLVARSRERLDERELAAACERADLVIADRWLPRSCQPRWLKADGRFLKEHGGAVIDLEAEKVETVSMHQGEHGWWKGELYE